MNRREFACSSLMVLAASRLRAASVARPVGFAAIGLGTISEIFSRGCAKSQSAKITALVTGHPEKGREWARRFNVPESSVYSYETFDRIRDNPAVDAVYIGLPNSMHAEYTLRAAAAGKHVLCEKPMAISSAECRQMIDGCKKANVKLMIAYRCHYDPTYLAAEKVVQSGALGQIVSFEGAFGFNAHPDQWRLTRQFAGGGSLLDVGIYPLNAARFFSREEPGAFTAVATTRDTASGRFKDMEETLSFTMKFPSGITASITSSYGAQVDGFLRINGEKGTIEIAPAFSYTGVHLKSWSPKILADSTSPDDDTFHFRLEAEHFAACIREGREPRTPGQEGLADFIAMEAIYRAAGTPIA